MFLLVICCLISITVENIYQSPLIHPDENLAAGDFSIQVIGESRLQELINKGLSLFTPATEKLGTYGPQSKWRTIRCEGKIVATVFCSPGEVLRLTDNVQMDSDGNFYLETDGY